MKTLGVLAVVVGLGGCGGAVTAAPDSGLSDVDAGSRKTSTGVESFDAGGLPSALVMTCDGAAKNVALRLPCLLGRNLLGGATPGLSVLECQLAGSDSASATDVALSLIVPLTDLPSELNRPVRLPFYDASPPNTGHGGAIGGYPGERFRASLSGTAVFSEVDPDGRAFAGRLQSATIDWQGDGGDAFSCRVADEPFWAAPGDFL